jgi:hypothetical protein
VSIELKTASGVVGFEEGARAVVDRLAGDRRVVGVHDAVDEPEVHPSRHQRRLSVDDAAEEGQGRDGVVGGVRVVSLDRVAGATARRSG